MKRFYMNIEQYFDEKKGVGILSTASGEGVVNSAVYARPHVLEGGQVAFIMRDKLTRANLLENGSANYLFIEHEHGFQGVRMYLEKTGETQDREKIAALSRRVAEKDDGVDRFLVTFRGVKVLVLVGDEELTLD